jgi:hypothetical protein
MAPVRATTPNNKGRDGNVASMRNPSLEEFVGTNLPLAEKNQETGEEQEKEKEQQVSARSRGTAATNGGGEERSNRKKPGGKAATAKV